MNLLAGRSADYIVTGSWSEAFKEAQLVAPGWLKGAVFVWRSTGEQLHPFTTGRRKSNSILSPPICTRARTKPFTASRYPLSASLIPACRWLPTSSQILSRPVNVEKFGLIYAWRAQKNIGPSGLTLVIVHRDLLGMAPLTLPTLLDYAVQAENGSMLNTPPTFGIYMAGLVFKWLQGAGRAGCIEQVNSEKASALYNCIATARRVFMSIRLIWIAVRA